MTKKKHLIALTGASALALTLMSGALPSHQASAALLQFAFTGAVGEVSPSVFPALNTGQTLSGSFTFQSTTPDSNPGANIGLYNGAIQGLTVNLGSFTGTLGSGSNAIRIQNLPSMDSFALTAPLSGNSVQGFAPLQFHIELDNNNGTAFTSAALPTTPPSLSSFASNQFRLVFEDASGNVRARGSLTSLTAVPLPAAVMLFSAGLIALIGLGAGGWRPQKNRFTMTA
ncbi:hypothetical protein W02_06910 [Nitrospira sp. KM1]|uniref:hypothetical protein n=1 Tax=Nitrospira sp. KM1 TaxID=1936990 RepID=UPI0013A76A27|nr:hypothetical protein [Nitrospira sp. KM1]BCA53551.1 hypothetical protein W02_06910 [Nitrospira sp. KM1]